MEFLKHLEKILGGASDLIWGYPLLILLLGTHIYLTFRLRFIQRYLGTAIRLSFKRSSEGTGDISQFGALTIALAAMIGTGNIVGVASAIAAGGPMYVLERGMKCRWLGFVILLTKIQPKLSIYQSFTRSRFLWNTPIYLYS